MRTRVRVLLAAALVIAVLAAYSNHFHNGFHFDDYHTIVNNASIRDIRAIPLFFIDATTFSSQPSNQSYRPVVSSTLALDYWLGGGTGDTFYFQLSTFLVFLLQGVLTYLLYLSVYQNAGRQPWLRLTAFFAVAWYLLHPANAETVNYVIARSEALATCSVVMAFVLYLYSPVCRRWLLYLVPVAVGALAKPTAVTFAPLLLAYVLLFEERGSPGGAPGASARAKLRSAAIKTLPALLLCCALAILVRKMDPPTWSPGEVPRFAYIATQPFVLLRYSIALFLPFDLSADTDLTPFASLADWRFVAGVVFLTALVIAAVAAARRERNRPIAFGLLWFLITSLPTSLVPLTEVMNDHRAFLPYVGLVMSVAWALGRLLLSLKPGSAWAPVYSRAVIAGILVLLAAYAQGTYRRNEVWRTEETLWRDVARKSPKNAKGLMNYGTALMDKGDYAGAEKCFRDALRLPGPHAYLNMSMGLLKATMGNPSEAGAYFRKAIAEEPHNPQGYFFYGRFLVDQKRQREAVENLEISVRLDDSLQLARAHLPTRHLLMAVYLDLAERERLSRLAAETLRLVPGDAVSAFYLKAAQVRGGFPGRG